MLLPENDSSQGHRLVLTVSYVPYSLESGCAASLNGGVAGRAVTRRRSSSSSLFLSSLELSDTKVYEP